MKIQLPTGSAACSMRGDTLEIEYVGLLRRAGVATFIQAMQDEKVRPQGPVIIRFEKSVWADRLLSETPVAAGCPALMYWPAAFLVSAAQISLWQAYATCLAAHGSLRGVFTDPEMALEWATERAQSALAQQRTDARTASTGRTWNTPCAVDLRPQLRRTFSQGPQPTGLHRPA